MAKIMNRVLSVLTLSRRDRGEVGHACIRCPVKRDSDRFVGSTGDKVVLSINAFLKWKLFYKKYYDPIII